MAVERFLSLQPRLPKISQNFISVLQIILSNRLSSGLCFKQTTYIFRVSNKTFQTRKKYPLHLESVKNQMQIDRGSVLLLFYNYLLRYDQTKNRENCIICRQKYFFYSNCQFQQPSKIISVICNMVTFYISYNFYLLNNGIPFFIRNYFLINLQFKKKKILMISYHQK